jgi:predicted acetyltransferase
MLRLVLPDSRYLASYVEALREGFYSGAGKPMQEGEIRKIEADPTEHFEKLNSQGGIFTPEDNIPRKRVPHNVYWLVEDDVFIGYCWLRYELNDFLEQYAGHVGYGIRPKMQRQGYGKKMLQLGLKKLVERDVKRVLVTCGDNNPASRKIIESCGGKLENVIPSVFNGSDMECRFWIDLMEVS